MDCRRNRRILLNAILAGFLLVTGCTTTPTPYQPYRSEGVGGVHGGYSEYRLGPDLYQVKFHGNEFTSRDRVENYLLYRAAELSVANGYDWFVITNRHTEHDVETRVQQSPWGHWQPHWRYYRPGLGWDLWHPEYGGPFWADQIDMRKVESFEVEAAIVMGKGTPTDPQAFDARRVIAEVGPTVELPR